MLLIPKILIITWRRFIAANNKSFLYLKLISKGKTVWKIDSINSFPRNILVHLKKNHTSFMLISAFTKSSITGNCKFRSRKTRTKFCFTDQKDIKITSWQRFKNSFVSQWVNIKMAKEKVLNMLFTYLQFYYPHYFGPCVSFPNLEYLKGLKIFH